MAGKYSAVEQSPKKFKLDDTLEDSCEVVHLDDLGNVKVNQFVTVIGKVIKVDPLDEVRSKEEKPLSKQDCRSFSLPLSLSSCSLCLSPLDN